MSITYAAAVKTDRMQATADRFDSGTLELLSAADAVLAVFALGDQIAAVSGAVWTVNFSTGSTTGEAAASGGVDATKAQIKTSGGTAEITTLTVGTSGTDIVLDNNNIDQGQTVTISSATITHAADPA